MTLALPARAALWPGSQAPDFTLAMAVNGRSSSFTLSQALKRGPVVLYFYPKAMTPGCTVQACGIKDSKSKYSRKGIEF
ncbi:MAG: redoxin domain-containing protein [Perlucidibaca sp.]